MDNFEERFNKLNKEQRQAVLSIEGPVLVLAGPGSGKTEILGLRVVNILKETQVFPKNILCLTFTDSAAVNMRNRLKTMIGSDAYKVGVHTFHSFGESVKNYYPEFFHNGALFSPIDEITKINLVEKIIDDLDYNNPLRTKLDDSYIYLKDIVSNISYLKKAGITPSEFEKILNKNEEFIEFLNPKINKVFNERLSKKSFIEIEKIIDDIDNFDGGDFPVEHINSLDVVIKKSLKRSLERSLEENKTSYLSEWKKEYTYKNDKKTREIKEKKYIEKMRALGFVYGVYQEKMRKSGYYDFDDMILDVITAIKKNDDLRYELQEQFLYILVDEFQDTNDAQMRLIQLLADAPVNEGKPNLMVVGDDDQAIFKFQGAEISNILRFEEKYKDSKVVVLKKSYRSHQDILNLARGIITQGEERLEDVRDYIVKELESKRKDKSGDIINKEFLTEIDEYYWISKEVKRLIDNGKRPEEIAVISKKHNNLKNIESYLNKIGVSVNYERQRDVLEEAHIKQIINISKFIISLIDSSKNDADYLLPEILSYDFWEIKKDDIWDISREAYKERKNWLECMKDSSNKKIKDVANFLIDLSLSFKNESLEKTLDKIIGNKELKSGFVSPFKEYYFSYEKLDEDIDSYIVFLSSLRVFIKSLREYKKKDFINLEDLVDFVDLHKKNDILLANNSNFISSNNSVNLLTAHKAKGMEFDTVFVVSCNDNIWAKPGRKSNLPFPKNLPIKPISDSLDDYLRLFYVAITRAKNNLYLSSYKYNDSGRELTRLNFLNFLSDNLDFVDDDFNKNRAESLLVSLSDDYNNSFNSKEKKILKKFLDDYKLNVTHLNNFLNVKDGGPINFFKQNILRFPQAKTGNLSFGTSVHNTINEIYKYLKNNSKKPKLEDVYSWFENFLKLERLEEKDFKTFLQKGKKLFKLFYKEKIDEFREDDVSEFNFYNEGVFVGDVPLSGKIDKMVFKDKNVLVCDFKTGKPLVEWDKGNDYEKIKSWKYKNQLLFYKLLVENSRNFEGYNVLKGYLEFLEPKNEKINDLYLDLKNEDLERLKKLIVNVYEKIINLDFPDVSGYEDNIKGIEKFEEDVLNST